MKRVDWQRVYAPQGTALDVRVRRTLRTLSDAPVRRVNMKKRIAWVFCAVLALASAVALAAGLLFSDRVDVQARAEQALAQRYGLTQDMLSVFCREVDEAAGTVTFTPVGEASDRLSERLGTYCVTVRRQRSGRTTASGSAATCPRRSGTPLCWGRRLSAALRARSGLKSCAAMRSWR